MDGSRDRAVGIATAYGLDDRGIGVRVLIGKSFFSPCHPDRFWGPPTLLSNGNLGLFLRDVKMSTHLKLMKVRGKWIYISTPLTHLCFTFYSYTDKNSV
jgi:hypothetical protein